LEKNLDDQDRAKPELVDEVLALGRDLAEGVHRARASVK